MALEKEKARIEEEERARLEAEAEKMAKLNKKRGGPPARKVKKMAPIAK